MSIFPSTVTAAQRLMNAQVLRRTKQKLTDVRVDVDQLLRRVGEQASEVRPQDNPLLVSGPFLFDYVCDPLWTGLQGRVFPTNHGHEYRVFTEFNDAMDDANTRFSTAPANFGLAPGNYANVSIATGLNSVAHRYCYGFGASGGGVRNARVNIGSTTLGDALTISDGSPEYTFHAMQFEGAIGSNSVLGAAINIVAFFEGVTFSRAVSADFAGAGFDRCNFRESGYMINSGHTPATVYFDSCRFTLTNAMVWTGGAQDHFFSNCELGALNDRIEIVDGNNDDIRFESCTFNTSGANKRAFLLNGAGATLGGLSFIGCDLGLPPDAFGTVRFQNHNGCISIQIIGNKWNKNNGIQRDYVYSDVEVRSAIILGNSFGFDGFGADIYNEQELATSSSVQGLFRNSIFGPNTPGQIAQYNITGVENEFYPASSAIGSSQPNPADFPGSITRMQAHAVAVR